LHSRRDSTAHPLGPRRQHEINKGESRDESDVARAMRRAKSIRDLFAWISESACLPAKAGDAAVTRFAVMTGRRALPGISHRSVSRESPLAVC